MTVIGMSLLINSSLNNVIYIFNIIQTLTEQVKRVIDYEQYRKLCILIINFCGKLSIEKNFLFKKD